MPIKTVFLSSTAKDLAKYRDAVYRDMVSSAAAVLELLAAQHAKQGTQGHLDDPVEDIKALLLVWGYVRTRE